MADPVVIDVPPAPAPAPAPSWMRTLGVGVTHLLPGLAGQVLPPIAGSAPVPEGVQPAGPVERMIPGAVTGLYGLPDSASQLITGKPLDVAGFHRANELAGMSNANALGMIPHMTPTNSQEELAADVGTAVGGVALPVPGEVFNTGSRVLNTIAHLVMPGSPHPVASSLLMGGAAAGLHELQQPSAAQTPSVPSSVISPANATPTTIDVPSDTRRSSNVTTVPNPFNGGATAPSQATGPQVIDVPTSPQAKVDLYAQKHGVPLALAHAVVGQESNYNSQAVNRESGASGIGQLMPDTARGLGVTDIHDVDQNLDASMRYLRQGMDATGTVQGAARFYYGGPDTAQWGQRTNAYAETIAQRYAQNVQRGMPGDVQNDASIIDVPGVIDVPPGNGVLPENWKVLTGAAAAIAIGLAGPAALRGTRSLVGLSKEQIYARDAATFNGKLASLATGADPTTLPSAPIAGNGIGTRIRGAVQDANAPLHDFVDAAATTPGMAERLKAEISLYKNAPAQNERFSSFMRSGVDQRTGNQYLAPEQHFSRVEALAPDQYKLYDDARWALNEVDNRVYNMNVRHLTEPESRVTLHDTDLGQLNQMIRDARADPVVSSLLDESKVMARQTMDRGRDWGYINNTDYRNVTGRHPYYLPSVDAQGNITHVYGDRDYTTNSGARTMTVDAIDLDRQHQYALHKDLEEKAVQRGVIETALEFQRRNPAAAKLVEELTTPAGGAAPVTPSQNTLKVPIGGQWRTFRVNSPSFYKALHFDPHTGGGVLRSLNYAKNLLQSFTTGPIAMLLGHPFAIIQASRGVLTTSAIRPAGTASGILDAGVRHLSGGRFGMPGDVVGTAVLNAHNLLDDTFHRGAQIIGEAFRQGNGNLSNRVLRGLLGDSTVDAMATRASLAHERSVLFERQQLGITGASGYASQELPVRIEGQANHKVFVPTDSSTHANLSKVPVFIRPGVQGWLNLKSVATEIHSLLSDAAAGSYYRLNSGRTPGMAWAKANMTREELAAATRDLLGDPGKRGGSHAMKVASDVVPYLNIAIQDNARLLKALRDNPSGTMMGLTMSLGLGAAASWLTALNYGPEAVEFLKSRLTNGQGSGDIILFPSNDKPVDHYTAINLSQRERVFKPVIEQMVGDAVGAIEHYMDPDAHMTAVQALSQFLNHHIEPETMNKTLAGFSSAWSPPVPGPMQAVMALGQHQLTPTWENLLSPNKSSSDMLQRMTMPLPGSTNAPNQAAGGDSITGTVSGNAMIQAMSAVLGFGGSFITSMVGGVRNDMKWGRDPWDIAQHLVERWGQNFTDEARGVNNLIWSAQQPLSKGTEINEQINNKLLAIRPLLTAKGDIMNQDQTRSGGPLRNLPPGGEGKISNDPTIQAAAMVVAGQARLIDQAYMRPVRDINKQIEDNDRSGQSPLVIRNEKNKLIKQRQDMLVHAMGMFNIIDENVSNVLGRHVRVEDVDWSKGMEQFK